MNYGRDDGSTGGGILTVICVLIAFCAGYWVRDQGVSIKVNIPQERAK